MASKSSIEIIVFSLTGLIVWYLFKYVSIYVYDSKDPIIVVLKKMPIVHTLTLLLSVGIAALFTALDTCSTNVVQCSGGNVVLDCRINCHVYYFYWSKG